MHECVSGCLASLVDDLAPVDALKLLDELPEELRGHEAMTTVTEKVLDVLVDVLENWTESAPPTVRGTGSSSTHWPKLWIAPTLTPRQPDRNTWNKHLPMCWLRLWGQ